MLALGVFFYEPQVRNGSVGVENSDSPYLLRKSITERLVLQDTMGISLVRRFENGNLNILDEEIVNNIKEDYKDMIYILTNIEQIKDYL